MARFNRMLEAIGDISTASSSSSGVSSGVNVNANKITSDEDFVEADLEKRNISSAKPEEIQKLMKQAPDMAKHYSKMSKAAGQKGDESKIKNTLDASLKMYQAQAEAKGNGASTSISPEDVKKAEDELNSLIKKNVTSLQNESLQQVPVIKRFKEMEHNPNVYWNRQLREFVEKRVSAALLLIDLSSLKMIALNATHCPYPRLKHKAEGDWGLPKGQIEDGESAVDAVIREAGEELGISNLEAVGIHLTPESLHDLGIREYTTSKNLHVFYYIASLEQLKTLEKNLIDDVNNQRWHSTFVSDDDGKTYPENDDFKLVQVEELNHPTRLVVEGILNSLS